MFTASQLRTILDNPADFSEMLAELIVDGDVERVYVGADAYYRLTEKGENTYDL